MSDRPSARDLQVAAKDKRRAKRECYDSILDKVYAKISTKAKIDWVRLVYEIPKFVVGLPPYDVNECAKYLTKALKKDGYFVEIYGDNVLYVSWDVNETKHQVPDKKSNYL